MVNCFPWHPYLDQELVSPAVQRLECVWRRDVVGEDATVRSAVKCDAKGLEPLLARGVPDLQFDGLPVQLDGADLEVDPDGGDVGLGVGVVGEAEQEAGLAHARVTDQEELEQVVAAREQNG